MEGIQICEDWATESLGLLEPPVPSSHYDLSDAYSSKALRNTRVRGLQDRLGLDGRNSANSMWRSVDGIRSRSDTTQDSRAGAPGLPCPCHNHPSACQCNL